MEVNLDIQSEIKWAGIETKNKILKMEVTMSNPISHHCELCSKFDINVDFHMFWNMPEIIDIYCFKSWESSFSVICNHTTDAVGLISAFSTFDI